MPLRYDLSKIEGFEALCYVDTPLGRVLNPVTEALIINDVGYREITAMNSADFFHRHCLLAAVLGAPVINGDGSDWYFTQGDVNAHIGLVTNHTQLTDSKFKAAVWQLVEEKARKLRIQHRVKVEA